VHRVRTPTLVIHSEQDYRCPLEQGQRWFAGLLRNGVDTEFLVFPGESHLLTLSGRPRHRRQRFDHLLRWWGSRLPVDGARPAGTGEE
jgi:dipeptidyl aminopeptidase/acylaminoacyl peptidase